MSLGDILAIMRRRWYCMVPLMLLSVLAGGYLFRTVPVSYESQSSVTLLDSSAIADLAPTFGNPLSNAGGSLVVTADVLIRTLQSSDSAKELHSRGVTDRYTVGFAPDADSPLLTLSVTGTDRAKVLRETTTLTKFTGEQLKALQAASKVPAVYAVQTAPVVLPQTPVSQPKSRYQNIAAVVIVGMVGAFLLSILAEGVAVVRRRGRAQPGYVPRRHRASPPSGPRGCWPGAWTRPRSSPAIWRWPSSSRRTSPCPHWAGSAPRRTSSPSSAFCGTSRPGSAAASCPPGAPGSCAW